MHKECDSDYDEEDIFLGVDESISDTKSNVKTLPALILAPTRELAIQVFFVIIRTQTTYALPYSGLNI